MSYRILNCSKSLENYYLCINEKIIGFTYKCASINDIVYICVKIDKYILCGARAVLSELTDYKPWEDADKYKQCFSIKNIEYCQPFKLNILSNIEHRNWYLMFVQSSKTIKDESAIKLLNNTFRDNKIDKLFLFPENKTITKNNTDNNENNSIDKDVIDIMGTFQTINFKNETDKYRGLQELVNRNFYNLFPFYNKEHTLLIPNSRKFITKGYENDITGIRGIPDALLIIYNKDLKTPFRINLIEYECYGEQKTRSLDKFNYLNGHIIPQLMRFASTFSIVTDTQIRESTIKSWTNKIIDYIFSENDIQNKVTSWIKELNPNIQEQKIALELQKLIVEAFKWDLRILLIIDELSTEQKDTLKNVINSFKLENNKGIIFNAYIVRLEQKVNILNTSYEYALSFQ